MMASTTSTWLAPRATRRVAGWLADAVVPVTLLLAVAVVLAPVPAALVDLLLAANLTVSVLAVLGALAARTPLEMSLFPTFLLGSTLVRLVLNVATTRLILARAADDGLAAGGEVVRAFGEFVAANNLVVGAVIFAIIAVIQLVVITAGSTRTSEVAARFALDGLPGRQQAIDADLQAGAISRDDARRARSDLQRQADFFASMDGASRFVRGEAVAGLVITAVNLLGGLAIGVLQRGMAPARAIEVYSRLTIGDGLASAVPSLLVSVATGLLISRSSQSTDLPRELGKQFATRPQVLTVTAVFLGLLSLSGLPFFPLAAMATVAGLAAWRTGRHAGAEAPPPADPLPARRTPAEAVLADDRIAVALGRGLLGLVHGDAALVARTASLRAQVAAEIGLVTPAVAFRDDAALPPRGYRITIAGDDVATGEFPAGRALCVPPPGAEPPGDGPEGSDPASGRTGTWLPPAQADIARQRGATILEPLDVLVALLDAGIRRHADRLLSRDGVTRLLESLRATAPSLVGSLLPDVLPVARIHRTFQALLRDGVPLRPLEEVLENLADHATTTTDPVALAELVRAPLVRTLCRRCRDGAGGLPVVRVDDDAAHQLAEGPRAAPQVVARIRRAVRARAARGTAPVVVVAAPLRRRVRDALAGLEPPVRVFATEELAGEDHVEVFATIGSAEVARAA